MLHVTNGDSAREPIAALGLGGDVLAWRDVLHEGPLPRPASFESLRPLRAMFLAGHDPDSARRIAEELAARDSRIDRSAAEDEVVLWFEHDLYDQLQLAQLLDRYGNPRRRPRRLTLAQSDDYLGRMSAAQLRALFAARLPITAAQLDAAATAWRAVTSDDPRDVERARDDAAALPFMRAALQRLLEELPAVAGGLSRAERQALEVLEAGPATLGDVYLRSHHQREDAIFLGDTTFVQIVRALTGPPALVTIDGDLSRGAFQCRAALTTSGRAVLAGDADRVRLLGIDRWIGGVHLSGRECRWRWDRMQGRVVGEQES
jgi:hypothetical protein